MTSAKTLYQLQQIDLEIQKKQEILNEISHQLGESEALVEAKVVLLAEERRLAELDKQQKDVEWEIEDLRTKISQLNEKLYGGKVKNPKELLSIEQEVGILKVNLREKEDHLLDLMTEVEAIRDKIKLDTERLKKLGGEWQKEQKLLTRKQAEIEGQLSDLSRKRQAWTSEIERESLELYEWIKSRKGQAVVRVEQGRCQGCRITLAVSEWQRVKGGTLVQCSSCGRILYLS